MTKGFTLIELLVVITVLIILGSVVWVIIDPVEFSKQGRDANRMTDLSSLQLSLGITAQETTALGAAILCHGQTGQPTPDQVLCEGTSNENGGNATDRTIDGTGWVKVNFSAQRSISVPTLPIDPVNDVTYYYTYVSDGVGWEINTVLESDKYREKMAGDGGNNDNAYEVGTKYNLIN